MAGLKMSDHRRYRLRIVIHEYLDIGVEEPDRSQALRSFQMACFSESKAAGG